VVLQAELSGYVAGLTARLGDDGEQLVTLPADYQLMVGGAAAASGACALSGCVSLCFCGGTACVLACCCLLRWHVVTC
jgi:hypothetical protein